MPQSVLDALTSVQVESNKGRRSGFQLTFAVSKQSPLQTLFLLAGGAIDPMVRVVSSSHSMACRRVMDGVVTNTGGARQRARQSTLTVTGEDLTALMDRSSSTAFPFPRRQPMCGWCSFCQVRALRHRACGDPADLSSTSRSRSNRSRSHKAPIWTISRTGRRCGYVFYIEPGPAPGTSIAYLGPDISRRASARTEH